VYEGRGWNIEGTHTLGYDDVSVGICIIGDYNNRLPLPIALSATQQLLACGVEKVEIITSGRPMSVVNLGYMG